MNDQLRAALLDCLAARARVLASRLLHSRVSTLDLIQELAKLQDLLKDVGEVK